MTWRPALAAAVVLLAAVTAAAVGSGTGTGSSDEAPTGSVTRLGPPQGVLVADYVADTRSALTRRTGSEPTYALVALEDYTRPDRLHPLLGNIEVVRALVRVPLPRVQTRLIDPSGHSSAAIEAGMRHAATELESDATRRDTEGDDVAAAVARAQVAPLRTACGCVLAAVVRADPPRLRALAERAGVRTVEAAPPGEPLSRLSFAPLLPEQRARVGPPPDDGAAALVDPEGRAGEEGASR